MSIKTKNLLSCLFFRPWLMVPFGMWIAVSVIYYWWLISRISLLETQNNVFKTQLRLSQTVMKQLSVESGSNYEVPVIPDAIGTLCETVHIALVCMAKCTRLITPMLKSILYHRQNPIHFHLVVDTSAQNTFTKLFDSWDLPDVKYSCYNAEERLVQVEWIPNSHYSGAYSLLKLLFPDILPDTLSQAIVLDSDLTFMCDVAELWSMFRNMTDDQFIGLVENESDWYLDTAKHWPAIGRGYNTGVMLLDLKKIRTNTDWTRLWQDAVNDNIDRLKKTTLADQDVINGVIKKEPRFLYNISCQYNVQMSTHTLAKNCYGENMNNVKIIHWNSPLKYKVRVRDVDFFREIHQAYANFDGNLLRQKLHRCSLIEPSTYKMNHSDLCLSFRAAQRVKLRTHLYYMDYSYVAVDSFDVTLVLQLSMDRLQFLERLVKYWEGPLSVAIYLSDCELTKLESFIRDWSDTLSSRKNIGYHLVFKHDDVHYPVNYLRNVALENVNTPYVFLMDVDFVPMVGLYEHLRKAIQLISPYPQKKALVVAAFETQRYRAVPPRSKAALLARLGARGPPDLAPFRAREWPRGHRATNYTRWATATAPYEVEWQTDYEPYLVVHRSVPKYDTRFSGFGWNKVSHSVELRAQGYRAVVLPGAFVLHTPHAPSHDITAFRADPHYRICLALLKQEFMDDLKRKYNVTFDDSSKTDPLYLGQAKSLILNQAKDNDVN
ncbi:LARGE xylosyl- and glucuronyltransferase 2-like [Trichoplusia ni]|uniref:LARGE xylosyl- and glucuronyltransferase 2-like n=1 Tax=Trichoplusia ni TaxID=7111 RepID=A0A7E5W9R6_TRINI|nr:LARGE xylosyl- and glucuronyltransferase 2-like [Trichoplusia ni]XP_026736940.1 LARGE xylosyl- and glucuronyltransferase 2-like [Trichoplusia ni]XP_026736941.1 LARGE xylosyl- and glucuronyltransferase 2-like [Trichoplusia ni]XP_026736942.1 LARGE xylosyl- and glucuronyltransferase 2-like [Trichoplusia ni]